MNEIVKNTIIAYYTPSEQMNNVLNNAKKIQAKYDKANVGRHEFLMNAMGKSLYKKCMNNGALDTFAPIPFSALGFTAEDFIKFQTVNNFVDPIGLSKLYQYIEIAYPKNMFKVYDNGDIRCDIVFKTIDDIIDFFEIILKCTNKANKTKMQVQDLNWRPICKKFNIYLS